MKYTEAEYPFTGYKLFIVYHKGMKRYMANLFISRNNRRTMSYARYLMSVHLKRELFPEENVDHINNDKEDDRIENLQILTRAENNKKSAMKPDLVTVVCPICKKEFVTKQWKINSRGIQTCSRRCGAIKGHLKRT